MVGLETDGNIDHTKKNVLNKISLFCLFLLGNMDKLNMTLGFPGLYFINTSEGGMALLNISIYGLALKSNVQVGKEFLMDEITRKTLSVKSTRASVQ